MSQISIKELRERGYPYTDIILQYIFNFTLSDIYRNSDKILNDSETDEFNRIQNLIKEGYPLQYAIGKWNFFGEDFTVNPSVLIPRPETEILVEQVLKENLDNKKILDIGTGSGAIAISIKKNSPKSQVYAVDISKSALEIAKLNAENIGVDVEFIESDLFSNVDMKFDYIVSNPPYLSEKEFENVDKILYHEPENAFVGGVEGFEIYERIIKESKDYLVDGAKIFFEIGFSQAQKVSSLLLENGYNNIKVLKDYSNLDRVLIGELCLIN